MTWSYMVNPLIRLEQITRQYGSVPQTQTVLREVSLSIFPGELLAILGPSGSGKSTLMNIIGLLDHSDHGHYYLHDHHVNVLADDVCSELRNRYIGFVFQQFNLLPRLTALHNVMLPLMYRATPLANAEEKALATLELVGMGPYASRRPVHLSGGQQQRVAIARALVGDPEVILADEPTGALDSATGKEIMSLFLKLNEQGRTVILITHDQRVAEQCRRRVHLVDGEIAQDSSR